MTLVLLALIWLPAHGHCLLERAGIDLLSDCCAAASSSAPAQSPCSGEVCCKPDSASYRVETLRKLKLTPAIPLVSLALSPPVDIPPAGMSESGFLTFAPPEFPVTWQFALRTALPPRAPSIAS